MGHMLVQAIVQSADCYLSGALDAETSAAIGSDAAAFTGQPVGVVVTSDIRHGLRRCGVLIDFTRPDGTMAHLAECRELGVNLVIGTTGFSEEQKLQISEASQGIAVVMAPNMSVGVNVTLKLLELAAKSLNSGYDIEIIETHHRHKVDAPSGTALKMGEVVAAAMGLDLNEHAVFSRQGNTGAREPSAIGFSAVRGGDIVGDHTVMFAGIGERIEITHKSSTRQGYAEGALRAARFLATKKSGLFDMFDVLSLK